MISHKIDMSTLSDINRYIYNRHFLPFGQADLTASASLRPIRGDKAQLHEPRLVSAATSTCE